MIGSFAASVPMVNKDGKVGIILLERCNVIDNVCDDREEAPYEFFYMYVYLFTVFSFW